MNALSLDTRGKMNTKAHSIEIHSLSSSYSPLSGSESGPPLFESESEDKTKAREALCIGQNNFEDQEENSEPYWSSSSDEDEKADVQLEGLRPRPVTEGEKVERYLLFGEQLERWAEPKPV